MWPVERLGQNNIKLKFGDDATPFFRHFSVVNELFIVPTVPRSPARLAAEALTVPLANCTCCWIHSAEVPLMQWQAEHGFAGVPEQTLRRLHEEDLILVH